MECWGRGPKPNRFEGGVVQLGPRLPSDPRFSATLAGEQTVSHADPESPEWSGLDFGLRADTTKAKRYCRRNSIFYSELRNGASNSCTGGAWRAGIITSFSISLTLTTYGLMRWRFGYIMQPRRSLLYTTVRKKTETRRQDRYNRQSTTVEQINWTLSLVQFCDGQ